MKILAIIPARAGSKRIKNKNIKEFLGAPIISYSVNSAKRSKLFDKIFLSTDSEKIQEIGKNLGIACPFLRSEKNSTDSAGTLDVINEVLSKLAVQGETYDFCCCLYPAAPFTTEELLIEAYQAIRDDNFSSAFPIIKFSHPPQRAFITNKDSIQLKYPQFRSTRTQDLETYFHDSGMFYFFNVKDYQRTRDIFGGKMKGIEVAEHLAQDIDNESDWILAEHKYRAFFKKGI